MMMMIIIDQSLPRGAAEVGRSPDNDDAMVQECGFLLVALPMN